MTRLPRHRGVARSVVLAAAVIATGGIGRADFTRIEFKIDPELSVLSMQGNADLSWTGLGIQQLDPQGIWRGSVPQLVPGFSDGSRAQYGGTILMDVDPDTRQFSFPGGSHIYGLPSGHWGPEIGGGDYGQTLTTMQVDPALYGFALGTIAWAAVRDLSFDYFTTPGVGQYAPDGSFDTFGSLHTTAGSLDSTDVFDNSFLPPDSFDLSDVLFDLNPPAWEQGEFSLAADGEAYLRLPIYIHQTVLLQLTTVQLLFRGQLVATRVSSSVVPEPGGCTLAAVGGAIILAAARRRRAYQWRSI